MSTKAQFARAVLPPRVPGALPVLGHGIPLLKRRLDFLREIRSYGPLVEIRIGPSPAYVVNDHALLHQMLVADGARFPRGIHFQKARAVAGNGIITASGPEHRRQRRLVLPAFNRKKIHGYGDIMRAIASERIQGWPHDTPIELKQEFVSLAATIATKCLFATELGNAAISTVETSLPILTRNVSLRAMDPTGLIEKLPSQGNRQFSTKMAELHQVIDQIIASYRRDAEAGDDLLSMFMMAHDEETGTGMTDRELRDEVISILLSSAETTALTMSWSCYELTENPGILARVRAELDTVLGDGRTPKFDELSSLTLTRRVIKEVLRMYPPTYFLSRSATEDIEFGGYRIPRGATMLYSFYSQHRDPELFRSPNTFDPDRWLPERSADVTPAAYMPFGEGVHRCVGEGFAWSEAMTVLATVIGQRDLRRPSGSSVRPVGTVTLAPQGLTMIAGRRAP